MSASDMMAQQPRDDGGSAPESHDRVRHPFADFERSFGSKMTSVFGSMTTFWVFVAWQLLWMALAILGAPLFSKDPYPFGFLLFLSNLIQLWALPVLGSTTNEADRKREAAADAQHEALTYIATRLDRVADKLEVEK